MPTALRPPPLGLVLAAAAAAVALIPAAAPAAHPPKAIRLVDTTWVCNGKVNLRSVTVTMTAASGAVRSNADAIHLQRGCTGRIGRVDITQSAGDGIKVAGGVHDLTIGGGSIRCLAKAPVLHQDGIQVLGGLRITFRNVSIDCGRADDRLINSNLFIRQAGKSTKPPTDVVCAGCTFGGWAAHTVSIQASVRSGVTSSSICLARFPQLTLDIGPAARDPLNGENTVRQCGPGRLTMNAAPGAVTFGRPVRFDGIFLAQKLGSPVTLERRAFDSTAFTPVTTVHTNEMSRWSALAHPGVEATYRARLGSVAGPEHLVRVRPRVTLKRVRGRYLVRALAGRSFAGQSVTLQQEVGKRWVKVRTLALGRLSSRRFTYAARGRAGGLRIVLDATPGYLPSVSARLRTLY